MDLSELNKEMFALQNDFQKNMNQKNSSNSNQFTNTQEVNFQPVKDIMDTTHIKRPTKSGEHRNDINEKMNMLNSTYFEPGIYNSQSPDMINKHTHNLQTTRNNSNYVNNINNLQPNQSRSPQKEPTQQTNNLTDYYNNNFDTLQIKKNTQMRYSNLDSSLNDSNSPEESYELQYNQMNKKNNINQNSTQNQNSSQNTHNNGISMLNVRNMYTLNDFSQESTLNNSNRINDTGYHRIEEKKTDYRQNMNYKLDNMIFDNPNAILSPHPILQQINNNGKTQGNTQGNTQGHYQKDTRMVIQDSNKDYYRQSSNERMSQYSPLSRSSNIPIHMANMSVNDFYGNNNGEINEMDKKLIEEEHNKLNSKEMLNNRLNNYTPLAKTVQYETNKSQQSSLNSQTKNTQPQHIQSSRQHMKPQQWNPLDVNSKLQNVVYNQLPIISNSERI